MTNCTTASPKANHGMVFEPELKLKRYNQLDIVCPVIFMISILHRVGVCVLLTTLYLSIVPASVVAQVSAPTRGSRCADAVLVCQLEMTQTRTDSTFLTEAPPQLPCFSTNANVTALRNGVWYKVKIYRSGTLGFTIRPLTGSGRTDTTANYDWAVFKLGDSSGCGALGSPVACNSESRGGITGAAGIVQDERGVENPAFSETIAKVQSGEEYLLLVLNPSNHATGFVLDFGFSSSPSVVIQAAVQVLSLATPSRICLTNTVTVRFSDLLRVGSMTPDAFRLESERGIQRPINLISAQRFGIAAIATVDAYDSVFTFQFNEPIFQTETYKLRVLRDIPSLCSILPSGATTASVISVGPRLDIRGLRAYCSGRGARLAASSDQFTAYLWTNLNTGNIVSTGSTAILPEGDYKLSVIDANGCMGESVATVRSTSAIALVLNAVDNKTRFCNRPDASEYVLLQATTEFERYEWLVNGVVTTGTVSEKYISDAPGRYQVRAFANGCVAESNVVNVQMFAVPSKPQLRQIGNYISVVNRIEAQERYFWIRVNRNGSTTGLFEYGWEYSPSQSGVYIVQVENVSGCKEHSDTLNFMLTPVQVRLATGSYQNNHSRPFDMRFTMTNITKSVTEVGATNVTFSLRFNNRILGPFSLAQQGVIGSVNDTATRSRFVTCRWLVPLSNSLAPVSIGTLRFIASLDKSTSATRLILENAFCTTPLGKILRGITFDLETTGTFRILNVPPGFVSTTASTQANEQKVALKITTLPNPVESSVSLRLSLQENSTVTAWIQDVLGNPIQYLISEESLQAGEYDRIFDVTAIPQGLYYIVVRTPTSVNTSLLSIRR